MKRRGFLARIAGAVLALVYCPTKLPGRQAPAFIIRTGQRDPTFNQAFVDASREHLAFTRAVNHEMHKLQQAINGELRNLAFKNSDVDPKEEGGGP